MLLPRVSHREAPGVVFPARVNSKMFWRTVIAPNTRRAGPATSRVGTQVGKPMSVLDRSEESSWRMIRPELPRDPPTTRLSPRAYITASLEHDQATDDMSPV